MCAQPAESSAAIELITLAASVLGSLSGSECLMCIRKCLDVSVSVCPPVLLTVLLIGR